MVIDYRESLDEVERICRELYLSCDLIGSPGEARTILLRYRLERELPDRLLVGLIRRDFNISREG